MHLQLKFIREAIDSEGRPCIKIVHCTVRTYDTAPIITSMVKDNWILESIIPKEPD